MTATPGQEQEIVPLKALRRLVTLGALVIALIHLVRPTWASDSVGHECGPPAT
jgi:hypothetical protein